MSSITHLPPVESQPQSMTASVKDPELERHADEGQQAILKILTAKYEEYQARLKQQG
jgi:hypothetical protein